MNQEEARKIIVAECKRHYKNECFSKCRCRQNTCIGTNKDNIWNEELAERIKEEDSLKSV